MRILAILTTLLLAGAHALAHEGEVHGDEPHAPAASQATPRFAAGSEEFELVGVLEGKVLTLYLDRRATNEPVADATIEIESGKFKGVAAQASPATYRVSLEGFTAPGKYPIAITVQSKDGSDLLAGTLEIAAPAAAATPPIGFRGAWAQRSAASAAIVLALFGAALWWRKRRGKRGFA